MPERLLPRRNRGRGGVKGYVLCEGQANRELAASQQIGEEAMQRRIGSRLAEQAHVSAIF